LSLIKLATHLNLNEAAPNDIQLSTPHSEANQFTQPSSIQHVSEKDRVKASLFGGKEKIAKANHLIYDVAPHAWIYKGSFIKNKRNYTYRWHLFLICYS
jgi:hypothetical protein